MDSLLDLAAVLRDLDADKVTERKKAVEKLRNLLSKSSVCQALTRHGEVKHHGSRGSLTWDSVLKAVISYVDTETQSLQKAKESTSAMSLAIRDRKKQEISSLFKFIVRAAEKGGGQLRSSWLLGHIQKVLKEESLCAAFGTDYSSVLLKNVLSVRKHWLEIPAKTWHELLRVYCRLFLDPGSRVDRLIVTRLIHILMDGASRQCDLQPKRILSFFTEVFRDIRSCSGMAVLEYIMAALNIFVQTIAPNGRVQICKLGETIVPGLLYLWNNYPSDSLKAGMVEFLQVQMQAHHPGGAKTQEAGAFCVDWDTWKSHLRKMYEAIHTDIDQLGGRQKFASGTGTVVMEDAYIELAADVCHQVYTEESESIDVTQTASGTQGLSGSASKKRRIMSGWSAVVDTIMTTTNTAHITPWLQLIGCVLARYPHTLLEMNVTNLLNALHRTMTFCKRNELHQHVFRCLISLARSMEQVDMPPKTFDVLTPVWTQVWSSVLSAMSSRQAAEAHGFQQQGFELLAAMVSCGTVQPDRHMWNLFLPDVSRPTPSSLTLLAHLLSTCRLPDKLRPSLLGLELASHTGSFPLRRHLLGWVALSLTPPHHATDATRTKARSYSDSVARLLVQLVLRDPSQFSAGVSESGQFSFGVRDPGLFSAGVKDCSQFSSGANEPGSWGHTGQASAGSVQDMDSMLEHCLSVGPVNKALLGGIYLLTTCGCTLDFEGSRKVVTVTTAGCEVCHVIPDLVTCLEEMLRGVIHDHLHSVEPQLIVAQQLALDCSVLSQCLRIAQQHGISLPGVEPLMGQVLGKLTSVLADFTGREANLPGILPAVLSLQAMLTFPSTQDPACYQTAETVRRHVPSRLTDLMLDLVTKKLVRPATSRSASRSKSDSMSLPKLHGPRSAHGKKSSRSTDDFDAFGDFGSWDGDGDQMDVDDAADGRDSDGEEEQQNSSAVGWSLLARETLNETQVLRNAILRFLCLLTGFDRRCAPGEVTPASFDIKATKKNLHAVLSADMFDPTYAADIQLVEEVLHTLLTEDHYVTDADLEAVMDVLRRVLQAQRQDQEMCCVVLKTLTHLVPCLTNHDHLSSQTLQDCQQMLLHFIGAFWSLQSEGRYASSVRACLARCMAVICQHDPDGQWGSLTLTNENEEEVDGDVTMPTVAAKFPHCLIDSSLVVRLFMAATVKRLFVTEVDGKQAPKPKEQQHKAFDEVYEICSNMMDIQGQLSVERAKDERWNRMASLLLTMAGAAIASPVCEKKALLALCQVIQEKNVNTALVAKMVQKMSFAFGYEATSSYLSCHLPFLISQWLDLDYPLPSFPFCLLQCNTIRHFYSTHVKVLVPQLFVRNGTDALSDLAAALGSSVEDVLKDCLPAVLVHILPIFAVSSMASTGATVSVTQHQITTATNCYDWLVTQLGKEEVNKSIEGLLPTIVNNVLGCLTVDRSQPHGGSCDPDPNPPWYDEDTVRATLNYLTQSCGSSRSLIALLAKTPDGLEQVLLALRLRMWRELRAYERLRCLHMLRVMVTMMLEELAATQLGGAWAFVLRCVITTLLHLLQPSCHRWGSVGVDCGYLNDITEVSLHLLRQVCSAAIECLWEELGKYLGSIVDVLTQLVQKDGTIGRTALELLRFLLLENSSVLQASVACLDPLPPDSAFSKMARHCHRIQIQAGPVSFHKEVEQVISAARDTTQPTKSLARRLQDLSQSVHTNRQQLSHLTDSQGSDLTGQLLSELLRLTQCPVGVVAEEAARCLGAVGPVSIRSASLPRPLASLGLEEALTVYRGTQYEKYCRVFHSLHRYLIDPSMEMVEMASRTLKKLLTTTKGTQFSADYKVKLADKDFLFQYLHPFRAPRHPKSAPSSGVSQPSLQQFQNQVGRAELWEPDHGDHSRWITELCGALIDSGAVSDPVLACLQPVCAMKVEFSEMLLPYLVHEILLTGSTQHRDLLSERISGFFHTHRHLTITTEDHPPSLCVRKEAVLVMLNVVNFLRQQKRPATGPRQVMTAWDNNFWLDLPYLDVAWAAHTCGAHFSAVLLAEIYWDCQRERGHLAELNICLMKLVLSACHTVQPSKKDAGQSTQDSTSPKDSSADLDSQQSSLFSEGCRDDGGGVQSLLLEAMRCIGDPDAVYGCGAGSLPDPSSRVETYKHEHCWHRAVVTLDVQMQQPVPSTQLQLLQAVQQFGGDYLVSACLSGQEGALTPDLTELQYQAAWKAGQWDLDLPHLTGTLAPLHQSLYSCLQAVRDRQPTLARHLLDKARTSLLHTFDTNMESCRSLYPLLSQLQCLRQFELLTIALASEDREAAVGRLLGISSQEEEETGGAEFEYLEPMYSLRVSVLRVLAADHTLPEAQGALQDVLLNTARAATLAGYYQLAERYLHEAQRHTGVEESKGLKTQLYLAQLFWQRCEHTTAKHALKSLIRRCQQFGDSDTVAVRLLTKSLCLYGNWLAETRSETPSVIMEQYLEKSVQLLESSKDNCGQEAVEGYLSLARFADAQYQNIVDYMSSPTFEAKQALMKKATAECEKYKAGSGQPQDRYLRILEKQSEIDKQEVKAMVEDRQRFLLHAVQCYASCLLQGDSHDLRIFRLTSMWFHNNTCPDVNQTMQECADKLKSYKFLPLMHQLAARMSTKVKDNKLFLPTLNKILVRASTDHPHHTLWVLLALANANKDEEVASQGQSAKRRGKLATGYNSKQDTEDRVEAAQQLLEELKCGSRVAPIVRDMEMLADAYVHLANWSAEQHKKENKPVPIPKTLKLSSVKDLTNVAVPSLDMKVDPSCSYKDMVWVVGFRSTFSLAGGINLPKIITCRCSDGRERRQLVKGRDDLRQDAIMQQVFSLVNQLLSHDPATSRRQLHVRTYKVVPLSRRSGLLEWCEGTQPIGEYLVGGAGNRGAGAHSRYRPKDWSFVDCRRHMMSVSNLSNVDKKYQVYMEACQHFQPVFRFFFLEMFPEPAHWFQRRLAYTRSVATNSIVGYILGLGDRHVMNILIDCRSAELIHIDLGIAFEQGHILPTPETVPFRLTRDIVDGMGVTGVEGVFRRCCEKTMEVMRGHQESLLTIVQVLLHDPLSEWTLSPQRAYQLQGRRKDCDTVDLNVSLTSSEVDLDVGAGGSEEPVNKLAERVLLRLRQKLQGLEDGVALSVAGQVNHLIQRARDPHNLSRLFPGWQPYL